jgi:hypothetical protein
MGLFSKILGKLGIGSKDEEKTASPTKKTSAPKSDYGDKLAKKAKSAMQEKPSIRKRGDMEMIDVVKKLEGLAAANSQDLDWKVSIVDLLKLLDIDSSFAARKELAKELHCPEENMGDSAKMNVWLHKKVLQKIADNGGNIPRQLLD